MWTVIYIAPNKAVAERYQNALVSEGILVQLRPIGSQESDDVSVEILVSESEAEEANEVLTNIRIS